MLDIFYFTFPFINISFKNYISNYVIYMSDRFQQYSTVSVNMLQLRITFKIYHILSTIYEEIRQGNF